VVGSVLTATLLQELTHFVEREGRLPPMHYRMAIRTHRAQIPNWINLVARSNARTRFVMMNMVEAGHHLPIRGGEIAVADAACKVNPAVITGGR